MFVGATKLFRDQSAKKSIPDAPVVLKTARRRPWLLRRNAIETGRATNASSEAGTRKQS